MVKKSYTKLKLRLGEAELELRYAPAALDISAGGAPVLAWNAGKHFIFEHLRQKQEGDPEGWWGENYKTHHDSKPKGPTAISLDLQFPGFSHLYGLPERATSLALKPTRGPDGPLSGACGCGWRLCGDASASERINVIVPCTCSWGTRVLAHAFAFIAQACTNCCVPLSPLYRSLCRAVPPVQS